MAAKILAFAGSSRNSSFNYKLVNASATAARAHGAEVTVLDMNDFQLPLYDQDLESKNGLPDPVKRLKELFVAHQGLLIASPEYNSSLSPMLKNTIDWVSRPAEGEGPLAAYDGKVAGIMAASPGGLGGIRGLVHLRAILQNIGVIVVPTQVAVSKAHEAFDEAGNLTEDFPGQLLTKMTASVVELAEKLNS